LDSGREPEQVLMYDTYLAVTYVGHMQSQVYGSTTDVGRKTAEKGTVEREWRPSPSDWGVRVRVVCGRYGHGG